MPRLILSAVRLFIRYKGSPKCSHEGRDEGRDKNSGVMYQYKADYCQTFQGEQYLRSPTTLQSQPILCNPSSLIDYQSLRAIAGRQR